MNKLPEHFQKYKIQTRLIIYYIVFAVITVALVAYFAYSQAEQSLHSSIQDKLETVAHLKVDFLNQWVDEQQSNAILLASLPELRLLSGKVLNPGSTLADRLEAREELTRLVILITQRSADFQDVQILDPHGMIVISASSANVGRSQLDQPFFSEGQTRIFTQGIYKSNLFGKPILTISAPLFDNTDKRVGVLALHFNMRRVDSIIQADQHLNEPIQSYLLSHEREIITEDPIILSHASAFKSLAIDSALEDGDDLAPYTNHDGVPVIGHYVWIENQDAVLLVEIDEEIALWPARHLAINIVAAGLLLSFALVFVVIIFAQRITAPLRTLTETVSRISTGDLDATAPVISQDEVGLLAQAFNSMTEKLRQTLSGLEEELRERKLAEESIRQSEDKYRALTEYIPAVVYTDLAHGLGQTIYISPQVKDMLGYSPEDWIVQPTLCNDLIHSEDLERVCKTREEAERSGRFSLDYRYVARDGRVVWVRDDALLLKDNDGKPQFWQGVMLDITAQRQAEEALRESDERFRKVFDSSPVAICITTLEEGRLLEANYAYWDLTGYDPQTSLGKNAEELKMWDVPEERKEFVQNLKARLSLFNPDDSFYHTDGSIRFVISFYELIQIKQQDCILAMFYDMSAQKRAVQALQQSETRTRALLEAIPDLIFEISSDGTFLKSIQPSVSSLLMPADQFLGRKIFDVLPESVAQQTLSAIQRTLSTGKLEAFEYQLARDDGIHDYEVRIVASGVDTTLAIVRNITQRKWAETEREKFISELEAKNRESETLRESLASIVTTFDIEQVVERILDQIKLVIPYDTASVWRVDGEWQTLIVSRDLPPEINRAELKFHIDSDNASRPLLYGEKSFVLSNDVQAELPDFQGPHSYINSWLAVPLIKRGKIIGLIALDGRQKRQFTQHHAELVETFANQVAIALENADLFNEIQNELAVREDLINELEQKNAEAETLRESLASIVGTFEFGEIIQRILDQIKRVVPYDSASIWRFEGNQQILIGGRDLPPEISIPDLELVINESNSALPIFKGEADFILNNSVQEQLVDFQEPPHNYVNSWLAVPLKTRGNIIGLIALDGKQKDQFTEHHAELAVSFANQVAVALDNASLVYELQFELEEKKDLVSELEAKNAEAETLREGTAIVAATLEIPETVQRILEQLQRVVPYDSASVWLYKEESAVMVGANGLVPEFTAYTQFKLSESEPDYPLWSQKVSYILLPDVQENYRQFRQPRLNYIRGWMAIPLQARGKLIGFISLDSRTPDRFTKHDAQLALTYVNQVAIALENARLFSELQSELEARRRLIAELEVKNIESETLRESAAIITATLEKDETIDRILEQLERVIPYDSASVQLVIGKMLVIVSARGHPSSMNDPDNKFEINENEPAYPVLCGDLPYVLFDDVQSQVAAFAEPPHNRIHAWMAVPLRVKGQIIGIIALDGYQAGKFTIHHAQLAVTFADQVAIAMENTRLFTDLQEELKKQIALRSASMAISSSLHLEQVLNEICKQMCVVNNGTSAYISQYDHAYSYYTVMADYMGPDANAAELVSDLGEIYYKKDGAYIFDETKGVDFTVVHSDDENVLPWTRDILSKYGGHSILYIPLYVQGRLLGHAELWDSRSRHEFTRDEITFCRVLCQQAAIAIANASLFEQLQQELIERKNLIAELENKNAELERFTYTVSHDLKSPLFTIRGFLGYLEQDALSGNLERMRTDMQRITDATEKMQNLLNDLLELSRIGRLKNASVKIPFEELAREAVELVQGRIMERNVSIQIDEPMPAVIGDRPRLLEVLQNLIDNAAKFMGTQKEPRIAIGQSGQEGEQPIFYVRDNGIGIAPEHFERVFGLFNKLDVKSDGTGIGLALVKRIVEVHGGRIWVESEVGMGAAFYFTLPPASL